MDPSFETETLAQDSFWAGEYPRPVLAAVTIAAGALTKGAVLGRKTADDKFILSASAVGDGSEVPAAVLYEDVDATEGEQTATVVLEGMVAESALNFGTGHDAASVLWPLRAFGIHIRTIQGA